MITTGFILLIISASVKALVLFGLGVFFIQRWSKQEKRFYTDFPFLMSLVMLMFSASKIFDLACYVIYSETPNFVTLDTPMTDVLGKIRMLLVMVTTFPYLCLMLIIWFGQKRKIQLGIGISWISIGFLAIVSISNYSQLQSFIPLLTLPPILLSVITYIIIHRNQRLPQINSLVLAIGWGSFMLAMIIRPILSGVGSSNDVWGFSWLCEIIEMITLIIIGLGFSKPAFYNEKLENITTTPAKEPVKTYIPKPNTELSQEIE